MRGPVILLDGRIAPLMQARRRFFGGSRSARVSTRREALPQRFVIGVVPALAASRPAVLGLTITIGVIPRATSFSAVAATIAWAMAIVMSAISNSRLPGEWRDAVARECASDVAPITLRPCAYSPATLSRLTALIPECENRIMPSRGSSRCARRIALPSLSTAWMKWYWRAPISPQTGWNEIIMLSTIGRKPTMVPCCVSRNRISRSISRSK
jgi:hypothetical protein